MQVFSGALEQWQKPQVVNAPASAAPAPLFAPVLAPRPHNEPDCVPTTLLSVALSAFQFLEIHI